MDTAERTLTNEAGDVIAWVSAGGCEADACRVARAEGFAVHLIPAHTDPRAREWTLALPFYHFATVDAAAGALERAWATAGEAHSIAERDAAYARHVPVKIAKGVGRQA